MKAIDSSKYVPSSKGKSEKTKKLFKKKKKEWGERAE